MTWIGTSGFPVSARSSRIARVTDPYVASKPFSPLMERIDETAELRRPHHIERRAVVRRLHPHGPDPAYRDACRGLLGSGEDRSVVDVHPGAEAAEDGVVGLSRGRCRDGGCREHDER